MGVIAKWKKHKFIVRSDLIRSFTDLNIKGGSEMETKENQKNNYVTWKNGKPMEVSLKVQLNVTTGCDVRKEAMKFVEESAEGVKDYFYVGGKKLFTCQVMLTDAEVSDVGMTSGGLWTRATVALTMKQCTKTGKGKKTGGKGGKSGTGDKKKKKKPFLQWVVDEAKKQIDKKGQKEEEKEKKLDAAEAIKRLQDNAKKATQEKKINTPNPKKVVTKDR